MIYLETGTFSVISCQLSTISGGTASILRLVEEDSRRVFTYSLVDYSPTFYYSDWLIDTNNVDPGHYKAYFYHYNGDLIKEDIAICWGVIPSRPTYAPPIEEKKIFRPLQ